MHRLVRTIRVMLLLALACSTCQSTETSQRIDPAGIRGKLLICGGGEMPEAVIHRFIELAGGEQARLVIIPTAASDESLGDHEKLIASWKKHNCASVKLLHTRSRDEANEEDFAKPLQEATGVWFGGGLQSRIADAYLGTRVERELSELLKRGGIVGGTSAGAAIQSKLMIAGGNPIPQIAEGFDLLPDAVIDQHFLKRDRKPRLLKCLADHPTKFGLGIDEGTAVLVHGRTMEVLGASTATVCLPASATRPIKEYTLKAEDRADLTALRRAVRARAAEKMSSTTPGPVVLANGSLILGGGGRMPRAVLEEFVKLAGGSDALIVILPTAAEVPGDDAVSERRMFERAGAKNIVVLNQTAYDEVESDHFLNKVNQARGVWFGGGRQWRFVDAYEGTRAIEAFHGVLKRGGVIGGSSAGASIQAEYLVRGSPLGNREMMAEGYERGFSFLPGTAVDQHFSQRKRQPDMEEVMKAFPHLLGIGIDESTALVVRGTRVDVRGEHKAWFYDPRKRTDSDEGLTVVPAGQSFDLEHRQLVSASAAE